MRSLTITIIFWVLVSIPTWAQTTDHIDSIKSEMIYNNCFENWPDAWRRHQICIDCQIYPYLDTVVLYTRSLLQNWNTFPFKLSGLFKINIPPTEPLAFNLIITNPNSDTVYNRKISHALINENWSFNIFFLYYLYTQESVKLINPLPGLYTLESIMESDQFTNHKVILSFHIDNPVPVKLNSFNLLVINNKIILNWITATEANCYGFEIERQAQGYSYETIGFVPGHGVSIIPQYYTFTDEPQSGSYLYRLKQIDLSGNCEYYQAIEVIIGYSNDYVLHQNYPNPFNSTTMISYELPQTSQVSLEVYNILGKKVATLDDKLLMTGNHTIIFDASTVPGGIYFYQLRTESCSLTKKMIILK